MFSESRNDRHCRIGDRAAANCLRDRDNATGIATTPQGSAVADAATPIVVKHHKTLLNIVKHHETHVKHCAPLVKHHETLLKHCENEVENKQLSL